MIYKTSSQKENSKQFRIQYWLSMVLNGPERTHLIQRCVIIIIIKNILNKLKQKMTNGRIKVNGRKKNRHQKYAAREEMKCDQVYYHIIHILIKK